MQLSRVQGGTSWVGSSDTAASSCLQLVPWHPAFPVPAVRLCESRAGAAGDPQLWAGGVGRRQVSGRALSLGPGWRGALTVVVAAAGYPGDSGAVPAPRFAFGFLARSRTRVLELPRRAAPAAAALPRSEPRPGEGEGVSGRPGKARAGEGTPGGRRDLLTWPERGNCAAKTLDRSQALQARRLPRAGKDLRGPTVASRRSCSQRP